MSVNGVGSAQTSNAAQAANTKAAAGNKAAEEAAAKEAAVEQPKDTYEAGKAESGKTYKPDMETIKKLKAENNSKINAFHQMVEKLFSQQAGKADSFLQSLVGGKKGDKNADVMINIDPETRAWAQSEIGEDGYWGVKQTSQRILDFAKAISGGDPSKINELERAFEKGYGAAAKTLGGNLPDISKQTYDAVKKGFADMREAAGVQA